MTKQIPNYNHKKTESKWQKFWEDTQAFTFKDRDDKPKYYVLEMLPYPSGKIHMGHLRNYTIGDVVARYRKMQGYNVLHPMGFDAFGLPAENAALQHKIHPKEWTYSNIENMKGELKAIGLSYDWNRSFATCDPDYYKHEQKIFIEFYKKGLAYQKESYVNWDPIDQTVLANEQVIDGRGWRSGALVEKKKLKQWFLKVSEFSEELLSELKNLPGWDQRVLTMQENWIGKSEGAVVSFSTKENERIEVYTTRPDTLFGASFLALSPHHPISAKLSINNQNIANFIKDCNKNAVDEQTLETTEKKGINTGLTVLNPLNNSVELPVYIANFVLMDYGTGAIFGCPAHDERDFEFAKKYDLPIKTVVANLSEFLAETDLINFSHPLIAEIVNKIKAEQKNEIEIVKAAYHLVRDHIDHSMDNDSYSSQKPYLKASDVLEQKNGFCFGKANLLCAILRGLEIPCGFSDQLLMFDENISDRKIIHNVNAVYLKSAKKWIRLDARGNKPADVNAEFSLDQEILAYPARSEFNEINDLGIYADITKEIINLYEKSASNARIIDNLFAKNSYEIKAPYTEDGVMFNSKFLDGIDNVEAKKQAINFLEKQGIGKRQINYRLRDWGVSRQRYWGCPIPMLYLEDGSVVPAEENDLPIQLPDDVKFDGNGSPLANHPTWKHTTYKGQKAIRETDTFDTFFESSWYFLRYISPKSEQPFDADLVNKIMPVDQYIGGIEHAVMHLLYARFFIKALKKCGYLNFDEPFKNLLTQGMVCHQTFKNEKGEWVFPTEVIQEGENFIHYQTKEKIIGGRSEKMSKSKKNVVEPLTIVDAYGADTARLFMMSDTPPEKNLEWSEAGIDGSWRYINRLWKLIEGFVLEHQTYDFNQISNQFFLEESLLGLEQNQINLLKLTHKSISDVKEELEKMGFNRAIAKIREFSNFIEKFEIKNDLDKKITFFAISNLVLLIAPIMPHLAEELWERLGNKNSISKNALFPNFNPKLTINDKVNIALQVNGKLRAVMEMAKDSSKEDLEKMALENEAVKKHLLDHQIKKIIVVPNKLVNIVA